MTNDSALRKFHSVQMSPEEQETFYTEIRSELKKLKNDQSLVPVHNTRIRHGFEIENESEQYMEFLAEVCSRGCILVKN